MKASYSAGDEKRYKKAHYANGYNPKKYGSRAKFISTNHTICRPSLDADNPNFVVSQETYFRANLKRINRQTGKSKKLRNAKKNGSKYHDKDDEDKVYETANEFLANMKNYGPKELNLARRSNHKGKNRKHRKRSNSKPENFYTHVLCANNVFSE